MKEKNLIWDGGDGRKENSARLDRRELFRGKRHPEKKETKQEKGEKRVGGGKGEKTGTKRGRRGANLGPDIDSEEKRIWNHNAEEKGTKETSRRPDGEFKWGRPVTPTCKTRERGRGAERREPEREQ